MRNWILLSLLALELFAATASSQAADLPPVVPSKTNAARLRWMQYNLVAGRIVVSSAYQGTNMTFGPSQSDRRSERLQIHINADQIDFRYELKNAEDAFSIDWSEATPFEPTGTLEIRRTLAEPAYTLRFEQSGKSPARLEIEEGETKHALAADSFWHLYLADPELVRKHLIPLMEVLRPSWQLATMGATVEEALLQRSQSSRQFAGRRWAQLVDDLASPEFAKRQSAQRELLSAGPVVLPFLQNLDRSRLDAEQLSRIRALVEALSADYEDTTDRIATWLAGDVQVWLSLASRGEAAKRRVAKEHLEALLNTPVDFDPAADEPTRKSQLDRLRTAIRKPPAG